MKQNRLIGRCPVCQSGVVITEVSCNQCGTSVRGRFDIPDLCRLPAELYEFLVVFVRNRGVIREVERELGISYPTVRARLDALLAALGYGVEPAPAADRAQVIEMLERGDISAEEAEKLLRGETEEKSGGNNE